MSKKKHSFDPDIAEKVGVVAAVIYEYIRYWVERNRKKGVNEQDGECWMFCSVKGFREHFPYMSVRGIRTALDKLEADGFIKTGRFNKRSFDRTTWFTICQNEQIELSKTAKPFAQNDKAFAQNDKPIPIKEYNYRIKLKNNNPYIPFEEVFKKYPLINDNPEVRESVLQFLDMRKAKKKPCTENGLELIFKKVIKFANDDTKTIIAAFQQSTMNSWTGVFEPKDDVKPKSNPKSGNQFTQLIEEEGLDDVDITDLGIDDEEEGGLFE